MAPIIGTAEDGQVVRATVNDTIVIKLPENPTTPVRWEFVGLEDSVELVADEYEHPGGFDYEHPRNGVEPIGAAAMRVLTLKPRKPGQIELKLRRWQESEGASSIEATFSCTLKIEEVASA